MNAGLSRSSGELRVASQGAHTSRLYRLNQYRTRAPGWRVTGARIDGKRVELPLESVLRMTCGVIR